MISRKVEIDLIGVASANCTPKPRAAGTDTAAVKLAGLYALERLAEQEVEQRQTVVKIRRAYLRIPFTHPDERIAAAERESFSRAEIEKVITPVAQELQVRQAAQRIV